ncbi:MAG TPA: hypothetical protein VGC76_11645 [Pyrinomonadaceae bacterium]|jgi:hypothetical protein
MSYPSTATIKKLSILSGNTCAFPNCPTPLVDEESGIITAQMCHIKAKNAGGARYDASQSNQERDAFENLILMCPIHHTVIDADVESYTVERLHQLKKNHELRVSVSNEPGNLEKLLEDYLRSIIEKGNLNSDSSKTIKEENSALMKAQKLAQEKMHNERRQEWLYSYDGLVDGINSVIEIFSLISQRISNNTEIFTTLGIELNDKEKNFLSIYTRKFGSQIELKGYEESHSYNNRLTNVSLQIVLFKKKPSPQAGFFYTEAITVITLKPDLAVDGQVVWKNTENKSMILNAEAVCEKMFDLLINQISKKESSEKKFHKESGEIDYSYENPFNNDYW